MSLEKSRQHSVIIPELYFLISKFLTAGPLKETAQVLRRELENHNVLPKRLDWEGNEHNQTFEELELKFPHISTQHLLEICGRIGPILEREIPPSVPGVVSLLGAGRQSLLRTLDTKLPPAQLLEHIVRWKEMPMIDTFDRKEPHNLVHVLQGREYSGPTTRKLLVPSSLYAKQQLLRRTLGHLSAVYCVLFDRTGQYIITGADDLLVKVWSVIDGRLLNTFRGASAEITDIDVNFENTLLAAGSLDRLLRVWELQSGAPVAVLSGHTGMITSINFCPSTRWDLRYLITTSTDGSVAFWTYTYNSKSVNKASFVSKPIQYHERMRPGQAQMICASFSPGGMFLAAGSADHHVRVYMMHGDEGPHRILELEAHTDTVDSIQWAHNGLRFISGSKDGTAHVWHFESQQWKSHQLLMSAKLPGTPPSDEETKKLKVTMVSWDCSDYWVITAVNDHTLKVWDAATGKLSRVLTGHTDEVYVLESHPKDPHILLSAGHDGQIFIWDIVKGESLARFLNTIEGQGHGAVFDAKWSPDGTMLAATDSHGHILMFGFGMGNERLKNLPKELFFHTDYRPLVRDNQHWVLDEQTQVPPHLMPPPFLVDVDGNPYPPVLQRLVPGREHCPSEQLIPNIALGDGGFQEVIEGIPAQEPRSDLDIMIAALAHRQYGEEPGNGDPDGMNGGPFNRHQNSPRSAHRVGLRRNGDVEGVRQSSGNWQHEGNIKWVKKTLVKPLGNSALHVAKALIGATGLKELETYRKEMKRRPIMISTAAVAGVGGKNGRTRRFGARKNAPAYRTRAVRSEQRQQEEEEELPDPDTITPSPSNSGDSGDSTAREEDLQESSSSSDSESSGYSDWVADHGVTLEPPKRSKRKPVKKRPLTPPTDSEKRRPARKKKVAQIPHQLIEVPETFRPPEWLSETIPRKAPYYPQMGDEVMYFRQGHQLYIDAVRSKRIYELSPRSEPWTRTHLREQEFVKVVGIKYEIRPPRLCCVKLALLDPDGKLTGDAFTIKYHDMADVLDFFVLKQTYDTAMLRNWQPGDRFRCMIDDGWWLGTIESQSPINSSFPDSPFMCYRIRWDNGEYEHMSPWDLEPICPSRMPTFLGAAVTVLQEEIEAMLYQPKSEEWPGGDREATCRRIIAGLDQVMGLAIAEPFAAPVDLNHYPSYAFVVEYPIDLSTIKARFENHFYRRITSAQFDVRYLATNAEKFNEPHSQIVKQARIITDLCLKIIKERNWIDVGAVYHQLVDTYQSSDSDVDIETTPGPSTSTGRVRSIRRSKRLDKSSDWRKEALSLLEVLWQCEDSTPFREPVDRLEHPDYYQMIDTPMDLGTIKEDLLGGNYETPMDFAKDMQLIFQNSRNFNTNKRSRIYSMTIRLSAMFEEHMHNIIYNWKSARRRESIIKRKKSTPVKMTTRYNGAPPPRLKPPMTSDEEDDLPLSHKKISPRFKENGFLNGDAAGSSQASTSRVVSNGPVSRPVIKLKITNKPGSSRHVSDESENSESEASSTTDSDSSVPISKLGLPGRRKKKHKSDSEESYKPNARKGKALVNRNTHFKGKTKRGGKGLKRRYGRHDSDSDFKLNKPSRRTPVKSRRKYKETDEDDSAEESEEQWDVSNNVEGKTSDNSVKSLPNNKNSSDSEHCLRSSMRRNLSSVDESSQSSVTRTSRTIKKQSYEELDSDVDVQNANDEGEEEEEEDDSDAEKESTGRPVRAARKNYRLMVQNENADEDEDDRPLGEVRRNFHLAVPHANDVDDDFVEEDSRPTRSARKNYRMTDSDSDAIGTITRPRRVKRRHYGEESDESADNGVVQTVKRRHLFYDSDDSARNEPSISISSRGRVRKLTARARALLRD